LSEGFKYYHFDFIRLNLFAQMNSIISEAQQDASMAPAEQE
jgi:hypothetical protein